jgi:hypothetical protein
LYPSLANSLVKFPDDIERGKNAIDRWGSANRIFTSDLHLVILRAEVLQRLGNSLLESHVSEVSLTGGQQKYGIGQKQEE